MGDRLPVVEFEQRTEGEALRLRRALADLRSSLESADKEVIVLLEEWQEALDDCDSCEAHIAKLQDRIRYQEIRLRELREVAASCFRKVSLRMTGAAQEVHIQSAPFVTIEHQQALQLQCWLLEGRSRWREVRVALSGGQLIYTRLTRSAFTRRKRHVQVAVDLAWIDGASADGDVLVGTSLWGGATLAVSIRLSAAGRDQLKRDVLVFCCETEAGMGFWANEINALKGRPPAPAARAPRAAVGGGGCVPPDADGLHRQPRRWRQRPRPLPRAAPPPLNSPMAVAPASRSRFNRLDVRGEAPDKDARPDRHRRRRAAAARRRTGVRLRRRRPSAPASAAATWATSMRVARGGAAAAGGRPSHRRRARPRRDAFVQPAGLPAERRRRAALGR